MQNDPTNLRIPGPTPIPPQVMEAMQQPAVPHRGEKFATLFAELQEQLKRIHGTQHDVYVVAGTGSAGWEASIVNTLNPGDKVLALVNGKMSAKSFRMHARTRLIARALAKLDLLAVQTDEHAQRLRALGVEPLSSKTPK